MPSPSKTNVSIPSRAVVAAATALHSMNRTSPSNTCVGTSHFAFGRSVSSAVKPWPDAVLAVKRTGRSDEHGVVVVVGDDPVDVAGHQRLGVVGEDLLRGA